MKLNEGFSPRSRLLLFQTLELLRKEIQPRFSDWKDADDWLFSELDFTKEELAQIYKGRNVMYHDGSAIDLESAELFGKRVQSIEKLLGRPIFSDEAKVVIDDLKVMLGVDVLNMNEEFATDAEREDMIRYVNRVIQEYHFEKEEQNMKDGFHEYMNVAIPLEDVISGAEAERLAKEDAKRLAEEKNKNWADEKMEELTAKPRSEWSADDWEAFNYIEGAQAESNYFDSLDDR